MFFENDSISISEEACTIALVPERLRGQQLEFDIKGAKGKVIVEAERRITARHIREIEKAGNDRY